MHENIYRQHCGFVNSHFEEFNGKNLNLLWYHMGKWKSSILLKTSHNLNNVEQKWNEFWTLRFSMHHVRGAFDVHVKLILGSFCSLGDFLKRTVSKCCPALLHVVVSYSNETYPEGSIWWSTSNYIVHCDNFSFQNIIVIIRIYHYILWKLENLSDHT